MIIEVEKADEGGYILRNNEDCSTTVKVNLQQVFDYMLEAFESRSEGNEKAYGKVIITPNKGITDEMVKAMHGMNITDHAIGSGKISDMLKTDIIDFAPESAVDKLKRAEGKDDK